MATFPPTVRGSPSRSDTHLLTPSCQIFCQKDVNRPSPRGCEYHKSPRTFAQPTHVSRAELAGGDSFYLSFRPLSFVTRRPRLVGSVLGAIL